jgi:hypothetical protein
MHMFWLWGSQIDDHLITGVGDERELLKAGHAAGANPFANRLEISNTA